MLLFSEESAFQGKRARVSPAVGKRVGGGGAVLARGRKHNQKWVPDALAAAEAAKRRVRAPASRRQTLSWSSQVPPAGEGSGQRRWTEGAVEPAGVRTVTRKAGRGGAGRPRGLHIRAVLDA